MRKISVLINFFFCISLLFFTANVFSQNIAGGHRGSITALIHNGETVLSCGDDGFLVTWSAKQRAAVERFQLTTYRIQAMVSNPVKNEICIIESSGAGDYRISAWNYSLKEKLFTLHSAEPVTYINYSAGGNFIIAAGFNGFPLTLIDSSTGAIFADPVISSGTTVLALTGRAERNMLIYQSEHEDYSGRSAFTGLIQYFDLESMSVTGSFEAPGYLSSPVVFGNNRFLAGINHDGLQIVDTTSGNVLDSRDISRNAILFPLSDGFYCLSGRDGNSVLYRFSVDRNGRLIENQRHSVNFGENVTITGMAYNQSMVFSSSQGNIIILGQQNRLSSFNYNYQTRITEIAKGNKSIAFLTEDGQLSFLPLNYTLINNSEPLTFTDTSNYNKISYIPVHEDTEHFLLWQDINTRTAPRLVYSNGAINDINLNFMSGRFPLRAVSAFNNGDTVRLLTLDSVGNIIVRDTQSLLGQNQSSSWEIIFNFSSMGAIDAVFFNEENFILSRSVINDNSPFLSVNIRTGETVPYFFPFAQAGLTVYSGNTGNIFAAAAEHSNDGFNTVFLDLTSASNINVIYRYPAEATFLSIAQSFSKQLSSHLAIACNSEGAKIFAATSNTGNLTMIGNFERTNGLPVKLFAADCFFVSLDSEGNIAWHEDRTGRLLAVFSLHGNRWKLHGDREITGSVQN